MFKLKLGAVLLAGTLCCHAQVYKYEDEEGWHFTDKPPAHLECEVVDPRCPPSREALPEDLDAYLTKQTSPHTTLERAVMGVVKVESKFAFGSGFFVSADGHIVTNRHVVRPIEPWQVQNVLERIHALEAALEQHKGYLANWREHLRSVEGRLEESRRYVEANPNDLPMTAQLERTETDFRDALVRYREAKRNYGQKKREFDNARWDFTMRSTSALSARKFTVTIEGGSELEAKLVAISKEWDLALLRIEGHKTPMLKPASQPLHLGDAVVAMGSSLAVKSALTSGIVSDLDPDSILTDARILAGNSGGPVVDADGNVVGVTSARLMADDVDGSFGVAIPVSHAETFWRQAIERETQATR